MQTLQPMQSVSHEFHRLKRIARPARRCWTEMCRQRKIDGANKKTKEDDSPKQRQKTNYKTPDESLPHPYTSTCFQLFVKV